MISKGRPSVQGGSFFLEIAPNHMIALALAPESGGEHIA